MQEHGCNVEDQKIAFVHPSRPWSAFWQESKRIQPALRPLGCHLEPLGLIEIIHERPLLPSASGRSGASTCKAAGLTGACSTDACLVLFQILLFSDAPLFAPPCLSSSSACVSPVLDSLLDSTRLGREGLKVFVNPALRHVQTLLEYCHSPSPMRTLVTPIQASV